jgi:hypothetical protein
MWETWKFFLEENAMACSFKFKIFRCAEISHQTNKGKGLREVVFEVLLHHTIVTVDQCSNVNLLKKASAFCFSF